MGGGSPGFDNYDAVFDRCGNAFIVAGAVLPRRNIREQYRGRISVREGAGYAGGIMSAALDGIRVACAVIEETQ